MRCLYPFVLAWGFFLILLGGLPALNPRVAVVLFFGIFYSSLWVVFIFFLVFDYSIKNWFLEKKIPHCWGFFFCVPRGGGSPVVQLFEVVFTFHRMLSELRK